MEFFVNFDASLDVDPQLRAEGKILGVAAGVDLQRGTISNDDIMNPGNPDMVVKDVTGVKLAASGFTKTEEKVNGKVVNTTVESNAIIGNF